MNDDERDIRHLLDALEMLVRTHAREDDHDGRVACVLGGEQYAAYVRLRATYPLPSDSIDPWLAKLERQDAPLATLMREREQRLFSWGISGNE